MVKKLYICFRGYQIKNQLNFETISKILFKSSLDKRLIIIRPSPFLLCSILTLVPNTVRKFSSYL